MIKACHVAALRRIRATSDSPKLTRDPLAVVARFAMEGAMIKVIGPLARDEPQQQVSGRPARARASARLLHISGENTVEKFKAFRRHHVSVVRAGIGLSLSADDFVKIV
ncbi:hypothetical protein EVAR_5626_1 [Eumeta japonica]|uniref:Uncharacterized protein n=1 Tax=Eumeta variegata TaxID=151549 RepID=A0A4C1T7Y5_EUMVA|nr:hypothetical protein EVAR_5626_1 [Eumeta japonica]